MTNLLDDSEPAHWPAPLLERLLNKPAALWQADDLVALAREYGIRLVALMHVGGDGWLKTLDFAPRDLHHFRDVLSGGERCDGSSLFGMMGINPGASDIVLRPQIATAFMDPFREGTLCVLCAHYGRDGKPLPESPDTILRKAAARLKTLTNVEMTALGEVEYFLGKKAGEEDFYGAADRGYHSAAPFVFGESLRRDALTSLAEMGVAIKYGHSEVGYVPTGEKEDRIWEQHEIELQLAPLVQSAYAVTLTHWVLRNLAYRASMRLSLEPVLQQGHPGNGLHFHFSPMVDTQHLEIGQENNKLPESATWLIAGLVRYGGTLMAFGNRESTSFLRLSQAKEAPSSVTWGRYNRKALVRLPIVATDEQGRLVSPETIEFRLSDGSAHPQLLLAGIAQTMCAARAMPDPRKLLATTEAEHVSANDNVMRIPKGFHEVAAVLKRDREVFEADGVFPPHVIEHTIDQLDRKHAMTL
ncbi:glutamine synthetase beta-grasp domain-containing protein [candidate division KSB1 bacterium]|nr:glutamine synthetase beta-grasp domain-containing protein [candidate division KSB1 bacterium]